MDETNPTVKTDARIAAVLDIVRLTHRFGQLQSLLMEQKGKLKKQTKRIRQLTDENSKLESVVKFGQEYVQRRKQEALNRLRALSLFSDANTLDGLERLLDTGDCTPREIEEIHSKIEREYLRHFPTIPSSKPQEEPNPPAVPVWQWNAYRFASNHHVSNQERKNS